MLYPNKIQTCMLLDRRFTDLENIAAAVREVFATQIGIDFAVPEARAGAFYHFFSRQDDLTITLEYLDHQADITCLNQTLASAVTELYCPDMRARIAAHQSHMLINLWHGPLGGLDAESRVNSYLRSIGHPRAGATAGQFSNRLTALRLSTQVACDLAPVTAVHWTQSNQLFSADMFTNLAGSSAAITLAIHPYLYGHSTDAQGRHKLGVGSIGVANFLGREVFIKPNILPWQANYMAISIFVEMAMARDGKVTADNFVMAPEDKSYGYVCVHHDHPGEDEELEYELIPVWHNDHDFITDDETHWPFLNSIGIPAGQRESVAAPPSPAPRSHTTRAPIMPGSFGRKGV